MTAKQKKDILSLLSAAGITEEQLREATGNVAAAPEERTKRMSCWDVSKVTIKRDGTFSHRTKTGTVRNYRKLSAEEAHTLLDENLEAGRFYAVSV